MHAKPSGRKVTPRAVPAAPCPLEISASALNGLINTMQDLLNGCASTRQCLPAIVSKIRYCKTSPASCGAQVYVLSKPPQVVDPTGRQVTFEGLGTLS
eukprot:355039-Chlamydomonas_euryale.AAC.13